MTRAALKDEIRRLPIGERVELLEELWREAEMEQPVLLDWQRELLEERQADASSNPDAWVSWEDAKRRLERLVLFAIDGEYISVYAVVHQARRPERWAPTSAAPRS